MMRLLKVLLLIAIAAALYQQWNKHPEIRSLIASEQPPATGFVQTAQPEGSKSGAVLILAPEDCPSEEARRADELASRLRRAGVPVVRSHHFSLSATNPSDAQRANIERTTAVLNGPIPAVFINGTGKSNPSFDEVLAEYRQTK